MDEASALLLQIESDFITAQRVYDPSDHRTYCQVIAKYQQMVEKSIKALVASLAEMGVLKIGTGFSHDVERLVASLLRLPHARQNKSIQQRVAATLNEFRRGEIRALSALVPKRPEPGQLRPKNTEYPFHKPDGSWCAPAEEGIFLRKDVERFSRLAEGIYIEVHRIISAVRRGEI